ncbi:MAG: hypothetical protein M1832_003176 [Thelocarpon impressellum]|nr:MAG: hypothetical protein M1832_003176 [Thelocarpon impressellum]
MATPLQPPADDERPSAAPLVERPTTGEPPSAATADSLRIERTRTASPGAPGAPPVRTRTRGSSSTSRRANASLLERFQEASVPSGMWSATGTTIAKAPTVGDIRRGSFSHDGWTAEGQTDRRRSSVGTGDDARARRVRPAPQASGALTREQRTASGSIGHIRETKAEHEAVASAAGDDKTKADAPVVAPVVAPPGDVKEGDATAVASERGSADSPASDPPLTGYRPPPKHTWGQATAIGLKGFWRFFITPFGFLVVVYGLNVVAWGGMLFLLLCNAAPAMCRPTCNDINSPRRIWIEIDSQILNALFCVTGFGLVPWRFRDLYFLLKWRVGKDHSMLRRLAGIHRSWFRLPNSDLLDVRSAAPVAAEDDPRAAVPLPLSKAPEPPLTGVRAKPTPLWKLDLVIWLFVANTFLQVVLSAFMWGLNRFDRPSWSTGLFVALASIVAGWAGFMQFREGKKIKVVEGVPISAEDQLILDEETPEAKGAPGVAEETREEKKKPFGLFAKKGVRPEDDEARA